MVVVVVAAQKRDPAYIRIPHPRFPGPAIAGTTGRKFSLDRQMGSRYLVRLPTPRSVKLLGHAGVLSAGPDGGRRLSRAVGGLMGSLEYK